ncbi:ATP synthase subunit I [Candidatus Kinetoplastidibacterium galati]|uniref:ATP synthase subunit I n=1 Tax=Candidatus Kinetoplastidibacterium galati TaxID=994695 RepID=UPI00059D84FC|nr:ATP synthase subunit I [Candidatus Kinetoplastibacterium galatii]
MSSIVRVIKCQWIISVILSVICFIAEWRIGVSFFLGCSAYLIPNFIFAISLYLLSNTDDYRLRSYFF